MSNDKVTVDVTTGIGTLSFPRVFKETADTNDKGETEYSVQIIIPKSDREGVRALLRAIKTVGEAKWGDRWKKVKSPLRDGDKEADELAEDGSTKGEKYPERLGSFFINARSKKPVGVYDRQRNPIQETDAIYAGCKGKVALTFYPYSTSGNTGIGVALNGVQKIADGEPIGGGGKPSVESMFEILDEDDLLDEDEYDDLEDEVEEEPEPVRRPAKKAAAKRAPARRKPAPEPEPEEDEYEDLEEDEEEEDEPAPPPRRKAPAKKAVAKKPAPARRRPAPEPEDEEDEDDLYEDLDESDD